jgi:hypothetical protein
VAVRADDVGHRVPTGFVDRHLVLIVEAFEAEGNRLAILDGPTLPKPAGRSLAGLSGRLYARLLTDNAGRGPVPFWRADDGKTQDTRLTPGQTDRSVFSVPAMAQKVRVRLLHRRTWPEVAEMKGWPDNETLIVDQTLELP